MGREISGIAHSRDTSWWMELGTSHCWKHWSLPGPVIHNRPIHNPWSVPTCAIFTLCITSASFTQMCLAFLVSIRLPRRSCAFCPGAEKDGRKYNTHHFRISPVPRNLSLQFSAWRLAVQNLWWYISVQTNFNLCRNCYQLSPPIPEPFSCRTQHKQRKPIVCFDAISATADFSSGLLSRYETPVSSHKWTTARALEMLSWKESASKCSSLIQNTLRVILAVLAQYLFVFEEPDSAFDTLDWEHCKVTRELLWDRVHCCRAPEFQKDVDVSGGSRDPRGFMGAVCF